MERLATMAEAAPAINTVDLCPEMVQLKEASARTGLSYDYLRKLCLSKKIVHVRAGAKYYINFGRLVDYLNTSRGEDDC